MLESILVATDGSPAAGPADSVKRAHGWSNGTIHRPRLPIAVARPCGRNRIAASTPQLSPSGRSPDSCNWCGCTIAMVPPLSLTEASESLLSTILPDPILAGGDTATGPHPRSVTVTAIPSTDAVNGTNHTFQEQAKKEPSNR